MASTTSPATLVTDLRRRYDAQSAMRLLEELTEHDRFQASLGIESAATAVAAAAERSGLSAVKVHRWQMDDDVRWWSFAGPPSWSPTAASLAVTSTRGEIARLEYPRDAHSLGAYSAPTPPGGVAAPLIRASRMECASDAKAKIVLLDGGHLRKITLDELETAGALGAVTCVGWPTGPRDDLRRRVELDFRSEMFAFSISATLMAALCAAEGPLRAHASVTIARQGRMPVVTGVLPGVSDRELLVQAHLCHPRPSANDNASGIAATMAAAASLASLGNRPARREGIRFLWGPEIVGTAAYLHDVVAAGHAVLPAEAINLDIVGQRGCRLTVEHPPGHVGAILPSVLEHCLDLSAAAGRAPRWEAGMFKGISDHAVFLDRSIGVPATQLGQTPDRLNHSSGDEPGSVDPASLRQAAVATAAALDIVARDPDPHALAGWIVDSARRRLRDAPHDRAGYLLDAARSSLAGVRIRHGLPEADSRELIACVERDAEAQRAGEPPSATNDGEGPAGWRATVIQRRWSGPFNLRAFVKSLGASDRQAVEGWIAEDRRGVYTSMLALALEIDDRSPSGVVVDRAIALTGQAIPSARAMLFFDGLCAAGWAEAA